MTPDDVQPLKLEHFLPYRLQQLSASINADFAQRLPTASSLGRDGGWAEWAILALIQREPGIMARDISNQTGLGKVAVSRSLMVLDQEGCIMRCRDALDRRIERINLTGRGLLRLAELNGAGEAYDEWLRLCCGPDILERIADLARAVSDAIAEHAVRRSHR